MARTTQSSTAICMVLVLLVIITSALFVPSPYPLNDVNLSGIGPADTGTHELALTLREPTISAVEQDSPFDKAIEFGRVLYVAMRSKDSVARWFFKNYPNVAETVQSPFDGDLRAELKEWGYQDDDELSKKIEHECDFDKYHRMKPVFDDLGLDTKAKVDGGPNECFRIDHMNGPAIKRKEDGTLPGESNQYYEVCGKEYRATGATFEFAANANGALVLSNVVSAAWSAKSAMMWGRPAKTEELPQLRSISDIGWGVWNRVAPNNLGGIKYLMVTNILNTGTRDIIRRALEALDPPKSTTSWPGHEFSMDSTGGQAILGSPVGRWTGYFLMQHKAQLGGNRFISKVRVFKTNAFPCLVFYVDPQQVSDGDPGPAPVDLLPSPVIARSDSGRAGHIGNPKNVVRKHVLGP